MSKARFTVQSLICCCLTAGAIFMGNVLASPVLLDIQGPLGSEAFGEEMVVLPNGNLVVVDTGFDLPGPIEDVGAVHLYEPDGVLISTLTGSNAGDEIGDRGILVLPNGDFVVRSQEWTNGGTATRVGAITQVDGMAGLSGMVSASNSLVGGSENERVGSSVTLLSNGNYVVSVSSWDNGDVSDVGAVIWVDADIGIAGEISSANALIGSQAGDEVGRVRALSNGNFVVTTAEWDHNGIIDVGFALWVDGLQGVIGEVNPNDALIGSVAGDRVGGDGVTELTNGNYVVVSDDWNNGAITAVGAATWGDGLLGVRGDVSVSNSIVGNSVDDRIDNIVPLTNGHYLVIAPSWDNGSILDAGAVVWADGDTGGVGTITTANSLHGSSPNDQVGNGDVTILSGGAAVVNSPNWSRAGIANAGASTWIDGTGPLSAAVSETNSLVGSTADDQVGLLGLELANDNYVIASAQWDHGSISNAGAITWADGSTGIVGPVSALNSVVGSSANDRMSRVLSLSNGNYVVGSSFWDNNGISNAGAIALADGTTGRVGELFEANALVGSQANDQVGSVLEEVGDGNFIALTAGWDNGLSPNVGAATWVNGESGISGQISASNSLVGTTPTDLVGQLGEVFGDGNALIRSGLFDNGAVANTGAVTWIDGDTGLTGPVSAANSLLGANAEDRLGASTATKLESFSDGTYALIAENWDSGGEADVGLVVFGRSDQPITGILSADEDTVQGGIAGGGSSLEVVYDVGRKRHFIGRPAENVITVRDTIVAADLVLEKTSGSFFTPPGGTINYEILIVNAGPRNVVGAQVTDTPPPVLSNVTWDCMAIDGATCQDANGVDQIDQTVDIPNGGAVMYTLSGTLPTTGNNPLTNTASVSNPITELNPSDNSDSDTDLVGLFADGMESVEP